MIIELAAHVQNAAWYSDINWVQNVTLTLPGQDPTTYTDGGGLFNDPERVATDGYQHDLQLRQADSIFFDTPARLPDSNGTTVWHADLRLVGVNPDGSLTTIQTMSYGFSLSSSGTVTKEPLKGVH